MSATPLLGTWSLQSNYSETEDGQRFFPLGEDATGYISYSADGFVFVHLMAHGRRPFSRNDPFGGTEAEDSSAMKSHLSYAGTFEYNGAQVVHRVTHCSFPNWVGTEQVRQVALVDTRLRLSVSGVLVDGKSVTAVLDWERASA
ncbi:MAG: lipocalin-like domain-containing protein [Pseudomonadota bacterium]